MTSILILGDVHLGAGQNLGKQSVGSALNSRVIDQLNLLDWTYEQAVDNNIHHIVLTGDIFEEPKPHYSLVVLFLDWLRKCSEYNISVHVIAGNHDILRSGQFTTSPLDIISSAEIDKVFVYKRINTLHLDGVGITLMPFKDRRTFNTDVNSEALDTLKAQLPYEVASIDDTSLKMVVGHLALEGSIPVGFELDDLANELFCPLDMFKGYDYVWMGHVHKFQIMSEKPHIAHIGSMDISDFGETDHTKYIVIVDPRKEEKFRYVALPTRKLNHITIQLPEVECNATQFVEEQIAKLGKLDNTILKVSIVLPGNASYSIDRTAIETSMYKSGAFHVSKISEERKFTSLKKQINQAIDNTVNELSAIRTYSTTIEEVLRDEFISLASEIVQEYKENSKV
jgi:DNA repair protein SbcD/Mre11